MMNFLNMEWFLCMKRIGNKIWREKILSTYMGYDESSLPKNVPMSAQKSTSQGESSDSNDNR